MFVDSTIALASIGLFSVSSGARIAARPLSYAAIFFSTSEGSRDMPDFMP
jgi:hypothetical protein